MTLMPLAEGGIGLANMLINVSAQQPKGESVMGLTPMLIYLVAIGAFFYFVMIRPQNKQKKEHESLLSSIAVGDVVLTSSGFYGVLIDITEDTVIVEFGNNKHCRIPMQKEAIVRVEKPE